MPHIQTVPWEVLSIAGGSCQCECVLRIGYELPCGVHQFADVPGLRDVARACVQAVQSDDDGWPVWQQHAGHDVLRLPGQFGKGPEDSELAPPAAYPCVLPVRLQDAALN